MWPNSSSYVNCKVQSKVYKQDGCSTMNKLYHIHLEGMLHPEVSTL